jgi:hypothetical protein
VKLPKIRSFFNRSLRITTGLSALAWIAVIGCSLQKVVGRPIGPIDYAAMRASVQPTIDLRARLSLSQSERISPSSSKSSKSSNSTHAKSCEQKRGLPLVGPVFFVGVTLLLLEEIESLKAVSYRGQELPCQEPIDDAMVVGEHQVHD